MPMNTPSTSAPLDEEVPISTDLEGMYRLILTRQNRLRQLIKMRAPEIILRNEQRMVREAVDALAKHTAERR